MHEDSRYCGQLRTTTNRATGKKQAWSTERGTTASNYPPWGSVKVKERIWSVDSELGEQLAGGPGPPLGARNWAYGRA